jgi:hypothetical protein
MQPATIKTPSNICFENGYRRRALSDLNAEKRLETFILRN